MLHLLEQGLEEHSWLPGLLIEQQNVFFLRTGDLGKPVRSISHTVFRVGTVDVPGEFGLPLWVLDDLASSWPFSVFQTTDKLIRQGINVDLVA